MDDHTIKEIIKQVIEQMETNKPNHSDGSIPVAVSARHVHLKQTDVEALFGKGYELTKRSDLSQPGQFAANETVVIAGPKGSIEGVRILGPARSLSQVEVSLTDAFKLGVRPPLRQSGDINGSGSITLIGPKGVVHLDQGLIIAQAHIHMNEQDAETLNVKDNEIVQVRIEGERPLVISKVRIRVSNRYALEMHIDTDEANAGFITQGARGYIQRETEESRPLIQAKEIKSSKITYTKKLLTKDDLESVSAEEIRVPKGTIITALAHDRARELNKTIVMI